MYLHTMSTDELNRAKRMYREFGEVPIIEVVTLSSGLSLYKLERVVTYVGPGHRDYETAKAAWLERQHQPAGVAVEISDNE